MIYYSPENQSSEGSASEPTILDIFNKYSSGDIEGSPNSHFQIALEISKLPTVKSLYQELALREQENNKGGLWDGLNGFIRFLRRSDDNPQMRVCIDGSIEIYSPDIARKMGLIREFLVKNGIPSPTEELVAFMSQPLLTVHPLRLPLEPKGSDIDSTLVLDPSNDSKAISSFFEVFDYLADLCPYYQSGPDSIESLASFYMWMNLWGDSIPRNLKLVLGSVLSCATYEFHRNINLSDEDEEEYFRKDDTFKPYEVSQMQICLEYAKKIRDHTDSYYLHARDFQKFLRSNLAQIFWEVGFSSQWLKRKERESINLYTERIKKAINYLLVQATPDIYRRNVIGFFGSITPLRYWISPIGQKISSSIEGIEQQQVCAPEQAQAPKDANEQSIQDPNNIRLIKIERLFIAGMIEEVGEDNFLNFLKSSKKLIDDLHSSKFDEQIAKGTYDNMELSEIREDCISILEHILILLDFNPAIWNQKEKGPAGEIAGCLYALIYDQALTQEGRDLYRRMHV